MIFRSLSILSFLLLAPAAQADRGDIICRYDFYSGFHDRSTKESRKEAFGTGFIANPDKGYVRKLVDQGMGKKETVRVRKTKAFASYLLMTQSSNFDKIDLRTYKDGRCYLMVEKRGYETIFMRGHID